MHCKYKNYVKKIISYLCINAYVHILNIQYRTINAFSVHLLLRLTVLRYLRQSAAFVYF